jgi:hypothetical protein
VDDRPEGQNKTGPALTGVPFQGGDRLLRLIQAVALGYGALGFQPKGTIFFQCKIRVQASSTVPPALKVGCCKNANWLLFHASQP